MQAGGYTILTWLVVLGAYILDKKYVTNID
jgi:hypothetical protein